MPLSSLDIKFYYTGDATGPSNNTLSLGGTIGSETIPDNTANNIFDDVTGDESASGDTEYRAIAVYADTVNSGGSYDMLNTKVWITGYDRATSGADTIYFALENPGGSPSSIQSIANEGVAPDADKFTVKTGETVSWTEEGSPSNTLTFGTVTSEQWFGIWLKRVVPAGASAYNNRSCTIKVQCETTASPYKHTIEREFVVEWPSSSEGVIPVQRNIQ